MSELVIASLLDVSRSLVNTSILDAFRKSKNEMKLHRVVDKMEEYLATFLSAHLIRAKAYSVPLIFDRSPFRQPTCLSTWCH